jgi:hypothetical protein
MFTPGSSASIRVREHTHAQRERERERERHTPAHTYACVGNVRFLYYQNISINYGQENNKKEA